MDVRRAIDELAAGWSMTGDMWSDVRELPTYAKWEDLRSRFVEHAAETFVRWITPDETHFRDQLIFAVGRFDEGAGLVRFFEKYASPPPRDRQIRVLDIGSGNGGVAFALANHKRYDVFTLDLVPNPDLVALRKALPVPVRSVVANGSATPFTSGVFDIVLLLDTIEHVQHPRELAREVMRILAPGGVCMLTTPARLRYLFGPDPHYGVPGLAFFPNDVQRLIVNHLVRRRIRDAQGNQAMPYDVTHLYWHVREIVRLFPGNKREEVLFNRPFDTAARFSREWFRYRLRNFLYDRILIYKA